MIIGIVAAILVPRVLISADTAKEKMREHHIAGLNRLVELYHMQQDAWPTALSDLEPGYLPDGLPTPPQGGSYVLDAVTHRVSHSP